MFLVHLMTIASLVIVLLIIFFSNLTPMLPVVFLGKSTVPIALGALILGALAAGISTSIVLRSLMFWQRPRQRPVVEPAEFSYEPSPPTTSDWETSRPNRDIVDEPPSRRKPQRLAEPEQPNDPQFQYVPPSDSVYDANYRVISQPSSHNPPPVVGSKMRSDSEDWGFDFEDEDEPKK
jgi:hypothetical protein